MQRNDRTLADGCSRPGVRLRRLRRGRVGGRAGLAVGKTVILLHPSLPSAGGSIAVKRGVQPNASRRRLNWQRGPPGRPTMTGTSLHAGAAFSTLSASGSRNRRAVLTTPDVIGPLRASTACIYPPACPSPPTTLTTHTPHSPHTHPHTHPHTPTLFRLQRVHLVAASRCPGPRHPRTGRRTKPPPGHHRRRRQQQSAAWMGCAAAAASRRSSAS